jgi:dipicolinate synthase subunit B
MTVGFALCGSFCTFSQAFPAMELLTRDYQVVPIFSAASAATDTRFGAAAEHLAQAAEICGTPVLQTIPQVEPIGPRKLLDALVVAPCTGNTLAKLAHGIADGPVTMAVKSHLRNGRPVVIAVSTNDGLGAAAENIGKLLARKHIYFVPFGQDDPLKKPTSLVADFSRIHETLEAALEGKQLQPMLL